MSEQTHSEQSGIRALCPGPVFDERGIGRWHDVDLMVVTAAQASKCCDGTVARMCVLLPGVLERIVELGGVDAVEAMV